MNSRYALFDWDNTVRKGYTLLSWVDYLTKKDIIDSELKKRLSAFDRDYRRGVITHDQYAVLACAEYARALEGIPVDVISRILAEYMSEDKKLLFHRVSRLFDMLYRSQVDTFIISGAPTVILNEYKDTFNIKEVFGFTEEAVSGRFTGNVLCNYGFDKGKTVGELISAYGCAPLLAFGDSESDTPMLDKAEYSFCIGNRLNKYNIIKGEVFSETFVRELQDLIDSII